MKQKIITKTILGILMAVCISGCLPVWNVNDGFNKDYVWIGHKTLKTVNGDHITGYWRKSISANQYEKVASYMEYQSCNMRFIGGSMPYYDWYSRSLPIGQVIPADKVMSIE